MCILRHLPPQAPPADDMGLVCALTSCESKEGQMMQAQYLCAVARCGSFLVKVLRPAVHHWPAVVSSLFIKSKFIQSVAGSFLCVRPSEQILFHGPSSSLINSFFSSNVALFISFCSHRVPKACITESFAASALRAESISACGASILCP